MPGLRRLFESEPLPLVRDGHLIWRNMKRELITEDELHGKLREQGVSDPSEVQVAYIEPDGQVSVLRRSTDRDEPQPAARGRSTTHPG